MVEATEAFAFGLSEGKDDVHFALIQHIRPGGAKPEVMETARRAFIEIARPCVAAGKSGAIEIEELDHGKPPQFCLVVPLVDRQRVAGVIGLISRCENMDQAKRKLAVISVWAPRLGDSR